MSVRIARVFQPIEEAQGKAWLRLVREQGVVWEARFTIAPDSPRFDSQGRLCVVWERYPYLGPTRPFPVVGRRRIS